MPDNQRFPTWQSIVDDPVLSRPPASGSPGNVPTGEDLRLDIGWERFEQLLVHIAGGFLGLNQLRFRRYGTSGQAQQGIDLAGRHPDGRHSVVQCKEYEAFSATDLEEAVEKFSEGTRPFRARHLIIAESTVARTTQLEDKLADLQNAHPDLDIELWGAEQINDLLRQRADIVSRFWTQETAATFCTGAPPPGVAAAPPNWLRVADQILLSPLGVDGLDEQLINADARRVNEPAVAAEMYQRLADRLSVDGFDGHAHVLRRKQLDALADANEIDGLAALAAQLAATALHEGDMYQAQQLNHRLHMLVLGHPQNATDSSPSNENAAAGTVSTVTRRHVELISAAVHAAEYPLGDSSTLTGVLRTPDGPTATPYQPLLVLLLAELRVVDTTITPFAPAAVAEAGAEPPNNRPPSEAKLAELDDLITSAVNQLAETPSTMVDSDTLLRLRLIRAGYDGDERTTLLTLARQLRLPRAHAAIVLAAQARRDALDGSPEDALEHWRQAVAHAIHEGRTNDAAGWLYAIRGVNIRFRPLTSRIDEEHLLAQALPRSSGGRLIRRVRDPETDARRAALEGRPLEAIQAGRRWLADSIIVGDWVDERAATELLGDLYAKNAEPERAAGCYQWAGETEKLTKLAAAVGDRLLPLASVGSGPWWQQTTSLAGIAAQQDMVDDAAAGALLSLLVNLVARGRAGELVDSPTHSLTLGATKTACVLAGRGTSDNAQALLDLFADDVAREENRYFYHDEEHVQACHSILVHHQELVWPALMRIFDLAEVGTPHALMALSDSPVLDLLREGSDSDDTATGMSDRAASQALTRHQRQLLQARLRVMAAAGRYDAGLAVFALGEPDEAVLERAVQARDRLLDRVEPDGYSFSFGTRIVPDSYLVTFLDLAQQQACLDKMLTVAADRREAAKNRQEALTAASNLVFDQNDEVKAGVHARSRAFVDGDLDGSVLDAQMTNPHPLSAMRVDFGSTSLRAAGLRLAQCSTVTDQDRMWLRERAVAMLGSNDEALVHTCAVTLSQLGADMISDLDAALLAVHPLPAVRQLATVVAVAKPAKYDRALRTLATDSDSSVRTLLAQLLHKAQRRRANGTRESTRERQGNDVEHDGPGTTTIDEVIGVLSQDVRHSVRRATAGLRS